tara:strand:- start:391 stop:579 length:189 start_codon:yes stop_codon:yes gene_type:complete
LYYNFIYINNMEPQTTNNSIFSVSNIVNTIQLINIPVMVDRIFNNKKIKTRVNRIPNHICGG